MYQPIHQGDNAGGVGKDFTPLLEGAVGGDQGRPLLIAPGNDLEQQVGVTVGVRKIADFIDDQKMRPCMLGQATFERVQV
jgi:hypothetical protein